MIKRRDFIRSSVLAGTGLGVSSILDLSCSHAEDEFSFVHLTDQHVYDKRDGVNGYRKCISSINNLSARPDFVMMGGDMVFDGAYNEKQDYLRWLGQFKSISNGLEMKWYPCMGNHDPFGMSARRKTTADDPDVGKKIIQNELEWPETYYSFDHKGWHFAVLDCIDPVMSETGLGYRPYISEAQLKWLASDLGAAGDRPKIVITHIAVLYMGTQASGNTEAKAMVPGMVLENNSALRVILERHSVIACLQGHCHHIEEFRYKSVRYITAAAGSGAWWAGDWVGDPQGYTLFHCRNGELTWQHLSYEWQARLEETDLLEKERQKEFDRMRQEQEFLRQKEQKLASGVGRI